jgi:conjugative transfer signal peptidase TraF
MRFLNWPRLWHLVGAGAVLSLGLGGDWHAAPRVIYNPSASAPQGWYWVSPAHAWKVNDYVVVDLPDPVKHLANQRQYLPQTVPLLKRIGALANQFVCVRGRSLWIDGRWSATALTHDARGRELIAWHGCRVLAADELLLIGRENSASFDSRYFGPIQISNVLGTALPLWTW